MGEMEFKIVSGGQTGIDQAALAAAVAASWGLGGLLGGWGAGRAHSATARGFWRSGEIAAVPSPQDMI